MPRLNLVIADNDEYYVENLGKYIRHGYSSGFNVTAFSENKPLREFLEANTSKIDLVLAGRTFYPLLAGAGCFKALVLLSDGRPHGIQGVKHEVKKFQRGEQILTELASIYASIYGSCGGFFKGSRPNAVITFFSPQGGSGKTTLAYGVASELCSKGKKVLYLNLEYIGYAPFAAEALNGINLSSIILHIKKSSHDLSARINAAAGLTGKAVAVLDPPDSPVELDELGGEEAAGLIRLLKETGHFDAVLVDMPSILSNMAAAFLKMSDIIISVMQQSEFAAGKYEFFRNAVERTMPEEAAGIFEKTVTVLNKCKSYETKPAGSEFCKKSFFIPYAEDILFKKEEKYLLNPVSKAYPYIEQIAAYLAAAGGEVRYGAAGSDHCTA